MDFEYRGKFWLKKGFRFPGLTDYIRKTREKLTKPLTLPDYVAAGERRRIRVLTEKTKEDPYLNRAAVNEMIRETNKSFTALHSISFGSHPVLYEVCMFATRTLMDTEPMIFMYDTQEKGYQYNAFAVDYQDKIWIYVSSQFFRERRMLTDREMCFLVGHELGHAQCHHSTLATMDSDTSDNEYSADRAGMIACARWILAHDPAATAEQAVREALLCGAAVLKKLTIGTKNGPGNTDWSEFSYEELRHEVEQNYVKAASMPLSDGTHPHDEHRVMAMDYFSESELMLRLIGADPSAYRNLRTDLQLDKAMAKLRTGKDQEGKS